MSIFRFSFATTTVLVALSALPLWSGAAGTDTSVHVEITSLRNTQGDVACLIFNAPDGYPETHAKAYREMHAVIDAGQAVCDFKGITPGDHAVIVFHDENRNGKMDKNFLGIPQEGYAASNNVRSLMSAPGFKEASFAVPAGAVTTLTVQVRY